MIKSKVILKLAEKAKKFSLDDADLTVEIILDTIAQALSEGRSVEIRGFGRFSVRHHPPRNARNPKTGERLITLDKYLPYFKSGKGLRDRINKT